MFGALVEVPASIAALPSPRARVSVGPPLFCRLPSRAFALLLLPLAVPQPHVVPLSRLLLVFVIVPLQLAFAVVPPDVVTVLSETIVFRSCTPPDPDCWMPPPVAPLAAAVPALLRLTVTFVSVLVPLVLSSPPPESPGPALLPVRVTFVNVPP